MTQQVNPLVILYPNKTLNFLVVLRVYSLPVFTFWRAHISKTPTDDCQIKNGRHTFEHQPPTPTTIMHTGEIGLGSAFFWLAALGPNSTATKFQNPHL